MDPLSKMLASVYLQQDTGSGGNGDPPSETPPATQPSGTTGDPENDEGNSDDENDEAIKFPTRQSFMKRLKRETQAELKKEAEKYGFSSPEEMFKAIEKANKDEQAKKSELDRERDRAAAAEKKANDAVTRANEQLIYAAVLVAAASDDFQIHDPDAAYRLMDRSSLTINNDSMEVEGIDDALKELLEERPYLKANNGSTGQKKQLPPSPSPSENTPKRHPVKDYIARTYKRSQKA